MRLTLHQTGSNDDLGESGCAICSSRFYLGPVSCFALSERARILLGAVCPSCITACPEYIQDLLEAEAAYHELAYQIAKDIAEEGVTDAPTIDEVLAAEAYYERPMFETWEEYDEAVRRGEIDL